MRGLIDDLQPLLPLIHPALGARLQEIAYTWPSCPSMASLQNQKKKLIDYHALVILFKYKGQSIPASAAYQFEEVAQGIAEAESGNQLLPFLPMAEGVDIAEETIFPVPLTELCLMEPEVIKISDN